MFGVTKTIFEVDCSSLASKPLALAMSAILQYGLILDLNFETSSNDLLDYSNNGHLFCLGSRISEFWAVNKMKRAVGTEAKQAFGRFSARRAFYDRNNKKVSLKGGK